MPFALLNPCWTSFEFEYALKLTKATRLFVQDQLLPTVLHAAKNVEMKNIYILGQKIEGFKTFEEIVDDARSRVIAPVSPRAVTKDTLAYLMFSSGTTGHPKGRRIAPHWFHRHWPLQAVMVSHGNIISNFNKSVHRSGLGLDSVSISFFQWLTAQHLLQIGCAQQHGIPIHFITISMCFSSGLTSYCFYPFLTPATFIIISNPSVEVTLETIARLVFHQFWYNSCCIYYNQVSSHNCSLPAILHTTTPTLPPHPGRWLRFSKISANLRFVFFIWTPWKDGRRNTAQVLFRPE